MSLINLSPLFEYQNNSWDNFTEFSTHIQEKYLERKKKIWFDGEGTFTLVSETITENFYFFSINNILYASVLTSIAESCLFNGVIEFNEDFLKSKCFNEILRGRSKKYNKFHTSVEIDLKAYDYGEEHKLIFSKVGKIDLLYFHHLINKGSVASFESKATTSLKVTIDWQKKVNDINLKMEKILADRKKT